MRTVKSEMKGNDAGTVLVNKRLAEQFKKFIKQYKLYVQ